MYASPIIVRETLRQAVNLLSKNEDAKLLAGGHTLLPTMKLRLAGPPQLIDLSRRSRDLAGIELERPLAHHRRDDAPCRRRTARRWCSRPFPALAKLAGMIGDPAVRHMGTIGGSVANNDPNADYPAACLGARRHHHHQQAQHRGRRFLQRHVRDRARAGEIITKVSFPMPKKAAYQKFRNPASRYALVGVFVAKRGSDIRVAVTGAGADGVFRVPRSRRR